MHLRTRALPIMLLLGIGLMGCGKTGDGKKFEGNIPSAGGADVTLHVAMS